MSPALDLGGFELRRFTRTPLTRAAVVTIVLLPLLYSGLYLWSFWNPQDNIDRLPVAMVMLDEGAVADGEEVRAGQDLADELADRRVFDWRAATPEQAERGVRDGTYYASLTIPADFSRRVSSPSGTGEPEPAYLDVHLDQARSYLFETIAKAVFNEVQASVNRTTIQRYLDKIFLSFGKLHDSTQEAADGANELADGAGRARSGAGELTDGISSAHDGAGALSRGLGTASRGARTLAGGLDTAKDGTGTLVDGALKLKAGSGELVKGLGTAQQGTHKLARGLHDAGQGVAKLAAGAAKLERGAAELAKGNAEAYGQVHRYRALVNRTADQAGPFLRRHAGDIGRLAESVTVAAAYLTDCLESLPEAVHAAKVRADRAYAALQEYLDTHPDLDPELRALLAAAVDAAQRLAELADGADALLREHLASLEDVAARARQAGALARALAATAPSLADTLDRARNQFNKLDDGLGKLAGGAAKLHKGTGEAAAGVGKLTRGIAELDTGAAKLDAGMAELVTGATRLDTGIGTLTGGATKLNAGMTKLAGGAGSLNTGLIRLSSGAGQLDTGLARLYGGAGELTGGLDELDRGAGTLADGLGDGAEQIPDYSAGERDARTAMMSDPVRINTRVDDPVPNYGTGFAPYFLPLGLWVGALITYMLLRPLNPRVLASATPSWRAALAGWLPATGIGALQVAALCALLKWGLGMQAQHWPALTAFLVLTSAAFMAIIQALNALLGAVGKVVALAALMLQLTSAGGTYPVETSAPFFQAISAFLPMTWVVAALRHLISGGYPVPVYQAAGVLVVFLLGGLALSTVAARLGRMWNITRLHPVLSL
ncbi:YhgE/Pip domain-containing protein [Nonomuraea typhae]|uniref:YhgE/Pip domain-containing protein n=1 Tax=Nonomuraea typhae TaxID=2603600 RepID=UPI0012FAF2FF|nr:YhgE/Pip domain-containing protein [Nonomuraea typhae]